ncbi:tumor necrosis factor alpha-induced protein 2-like isoform X2 [Bombina bombina]|uniref:tumor necrosis factor alpha-induced protein 2-like isoform X2 n=1 Tax=Bombina bombina TaxID=8345 RepID=UPI00235ACC19|nr:tumor necrosis factor alpha-induced protein 2-like isoform X2 [Bombina bombina]
MVQCCVHILLNIFFAGLTVLSKFSKMVGQSEKPNSTNENHINEQIEEGSKHRSGVLKRIRKCVMRNLFPNDRATSPTNKNITAETIEEKLLQKRYQDASKDLITLEHNICKLIDDKQREEKKLQLEMLYEKLENEVFQVIKKSITQVDLMEQSIKAILEQEIEDSQYIENSGNLTTNIGRPRKWRQKWKNVVKLSVQDRISQIPERPPGALKSSLSYTLGYLGRTCKNDLIYVVEALEQYYPDEFDVCNVYAQHYHQELKSIVENFEHEKKDIHLLLSWVFNIYPKKILNDAALVRHIDSTNLEPLLSQRKIREFEEYYLPYEVNSVRNWMNKSLDLEFELCNEDKEPVTLGEYYHSELQIDVIQIYNGGLKRAEEIRPELSKEISPLLAKELEAFLKRYKRVFEIYIKKNKSQQFFKAIVIANINCCRNFRDYINGKNIDLEAEMKQNMNLILQDFETLGNDILLKDLFLDLKEIFKKIMKRKSHRDHYESMIEIIKKTERHISPYNTLICPCYQNMMGKVHIHLVLEYVTRLLKKKVSIKNHNEQQNLATQICHTAALIEKFCSESNASWLNPLIHQLAEIISLKDVNAIQVEVAALANVYPDIEKKHIRALLHIKGDLSTEDVHTVLQILKTRNTENQHTNPSFFSLIKDC